MSSSVQTDCNGSSYSILNDRFIGDLENIIDISSWAIDKLGENRHDRLLVGKLLRLMVLKIRLGVMYTTGMSLPHSTWIFRRHSRHAATLTGMLRAMVLIRPGVPY